MRSNIRLGRLKTGIGLLKLALRRLKSLVVCGEQVPIGETVSLKETDQERKKFNKQGEILEKKENKHNTPPSKSELEVPRTIPEKPECLPRANQSQPEFMVLGDSIKFSKAETGSFANQPILLPISSPLLEQGSVSTIGLISPVPNLSFSPIDKENSIKAKQILQIFQELKDSENDFITSMKLVARYFVEPSLMRCLNLSTTCTPLVKLKSYLTDLIVGHEKLLATMRENRLSTTLTAIEQILTDLCYPEYSGTASLVVFLVKVKMIPFELTFLSQIVKFLEKCQPSPRKQDLSVFLLLQKPIARISKYPLFLTSMILIQPSSITLLHSLQSIHVKLTDIDMRIGNENVKVESIMQLDLTMDYYAKVQKMAQSFGPLMYRGDFMAVTMESMGWKKFRTHLELVHVLCHQFHLVVAEKKERTAPKPNIRYIIPFSHCELIENVRGCVRGLTCSGNFATKIRFQKDCLWYEILLVSLEEEDHANFLQSVRNIVGIPRNQKYNSGNDCFVDSRTGIFDIIGQGDRSRTYARHVFNVDIGRALQQLR